MAKPKSKSIKTPELKDELSDLNAKYLRALADYQNLEKRTKEQQLHFAQISTASFITKLLPIIDNLHMAADHLQDSGLNLILSDLNSTLSAEGVEIIDPLDHLFDAEVMECVELVEGPSDQVVKVISKGYKLNGLLLRPAKVKVGNTNQ